MKTRRGFTLVELLVIVAIVVLLTAMIVPAILRVRLVELRLGNEMNLRAIASAMHAYAANHQGKLPGIIDPTGMTNPSQSGDEQALWVYVPYLEPERRKPYWDGADPSGYPTIRAYTSPSDFSLQEAGLITDEANRQNQLLLGTSSYATNMLFHTGRPRLGSAASDGLAQTIYVAEHYFLTEDGGTKITYTRGINNWAKDPNARENWFSIRYASFADRGWLDVMPVTLGRPPVSRPSRAGVTFQHRPSVKDADHRLLQSTLPCGLLVAMCDGSVRCITPEVSEPVFWALVTPAGGEGVTFPQD